MTIKLSIIIPTYNEENTILQLINKVKNVEFDKINVIKEIIVIDDGSKDNTLKVISNQEHVKIIRHKHNIGKSAAVRTGIKFSTGDIILIQDADLEYDPNDYTALIIPIITGKAKVVYGSRRLKKANKQHSGFSFYLGGIGLTMIANIIYPNLKITDEPTCYKVFDANLLKSIPLKCKRFEFCPEITAKIAKRKIKIHEVPISYFPRNSSEGKKIKWKDGIEAVWTLIKYRFIN